MFRSFHKVKMACTMFRACKALTNCVKSTSVAKNTLLHNDAATSLLMPQILTLQNTRNTSFYMRRSAAQLWKGVTSVSNAGKRRGRARGTPRARDLNRGQKLGVGKIPIVFPGLNAPIVQGDFIVQQRRVQTQEQEQKVSPVGKDLPRLRKYGFKVPAHKRGWSGGILGGRKIGPPQPVDGDAFDGFETWILYSKTVSVMTSNMGRSKAARSMVITGNRNGLAGFTMVTGKDIKSTLSTATNKAGQRLIYVERYNDHTVLHDFFAQFGKTKLFVEQKPMGYGLKCHRVIRACCEALGIKDLYAKVEGAVNTKHIVNAFFIGLLHQKSHEEIANDKKLHLVELRKENNYFPTVLASPPVTRSESEIPSDENLDFKQYVMGGRLPLQKKRRPPFYTKLPSYTIYQRKQERRRGQDEVLLRLRAQYGDLCSFLAEKYPEARASKWRKARKIEEEESSEV